MRRSRAAFEYGLCFLILAVIEWFFFRNVFRTPGLIGDRGDGRFTMLVAEHWFHVLRGEHRITELGIFFPAANTLAFSDMLLGIGLIHSLLRLIGLSVYSAYKYSIILIHFFGTVTMFWLLWKLLFLKLEWALFGTIAFSFSNGYAIGITHTQLVALSMLPFAVVIFVLLVRNISIQSKRIVLALLEITWMALVLYTSWYIAFFSALFVSVLTVCIIVRIFIRKNKASINYPKPKKTVLELIAYGLYGLFLLVPFVYMELPILRMSDGRSWDDVIGSLPEVIDLINVSSSNFLLGNWIKLLNLEQRGYSGELKAGFSIVLLATFLFCMHESRNNERHNSERDKIVRIVGLTVVINLIIMLKLGSNGISLWWFVYTLFPGGTSIRAVARYMIFLSFPMSCVTSVLGNSISLKRDVHIVYTFCITFVLCGLFVSNVTYNGVQSEWTSIDEQSFVDSIQAPPNNCSCLYIRNSSESNNAFSQLDAYEIADHYGVNTINGYSGLYPNGWDQIWDVNSESYEDAVYSWILQYNLQNVYVCDLDTNRWVSCEESMVSTRFDGKNKEIPDWSYGLLGIAPTEEFSWTDKEVEMILKDSEIGDDGILLKIGTLYDEYLRQQPDLEPYITVTVNDKDKMDIPVINGYGEYIIDVTKADNDIYDIMITTNCYFNPEKLKNSNDSRDLSLQLYYLGAA